MNNTIKTDVLIAGCGCSGLYMAMNLPADKKILMITKSDCESSDSFLAQGGMCMLKCEEDYDSYFEDTMKAGHYENDKKSVEIMIRSSADVVKDLVDCGARFAREADGSLAYTREGAHSSNRIIFHEDITGKEITSHLLEKVRTLPNVTIMEYTRLLDIISRDNRCLGAVIRGATSHYDYVCSEVSKGIANVSLASDIPVMFGVLTTDTIEQAIERAGTKAGNKGFECAEGAIEMVNLIKEIEG